MKISAIIDLVNKGTLDEQFKILTCNGNIQQEKTRWLTLLEKALREGDKDACLISAPGRCEIGGNHTDHQRGKVLAGSVNMDLAAVVVVEGDSVVYVADNFKVNPIKINDLKFRQEEVFTTESLIRGILSRFNELGHRIGGFSVYTHSNVLQGSGMSSSAAFEVLIGTILNECFNDGKISAVDIAKIGQYAENHYFNKPCGLLDQMACSVGGFVTIDFFDKNNPIVEKIDFNFAESNYALCLVDTKGSHADLSNEYGLMPQEMKQVAAFFNKEVLSEITMEELLASLSDVKKNVSDRAILRAIHFLNETKRVDKQVLALKNNDLEAFKALIIESGYSSYMYLQNVFTPNDVQHQPLSVALAVSEQLLKGSGAYRVHGGGLAGTIQAFVPKEKLSHYKTMMNSIFGEGACLECSIRPVGGYKFKV